MIKSIFVTSFIMAANAAMVAAIVAMVKSGWQSPWLGTLIACGVPAMFFNLLLIKPRARTSQNLYSLILAGAVGSAVALYLGAPLVSWPVGLAIVVGLLASLAYVFWYSRFGHPSNQALAEGAQLAPFELIENGQRFNTAEMTHKPALWIFYRGNWCPLCMAQIKEIAAQYRELARRGVEVFLVSPQKEENSIALSKKFDAPMRFMTDPDNRAAETLGILVKGGLPAGFQAMGYDSDVPRPTVFITAPGGKILYLDMTDNYRVRPEPQVFFSVLEKHAIV